MNYKKISISIILLSCFAITNKIVTMNTDNTGGWELAIPVVDDNLTLLFNGDGTIFESREDSITRRRQEIEEREHKKKLEVDKNIARVSREGLKEKDIDDWIIDSILEKRLSSTGLKSLIKYGLEKYVNYKSDDITKKIINTETLLKVAIKAKNLEFVKLLVSIGAKIDDNAMKALDDEYSKIKLGPKFNFNLRSAEEIARIEEIDQFLHEAKSQQDAMPEFTKSLMQKTSPNTPKNAKPDVKIKFAK